MRATAAPDGHVTVQDMADLQQLTALSRIQSVLPQDMTRHEVDVGLEEEEDLGLEEVAPGVDDHSEEEMGEEEEEEEKGDGDEDEEEDEEEAAGAQLPWHAPRRMVSGSVSRIGDRDHNEDARIAVDDLEADARSAGLLGGDGTGVAAFYAVIDGHGGDSASTFAKKRLLQYLLQAAASAAVGAAGVRGDPKAAVRAAFLRLDDDLRRRCGGPASGRCSGAVAVAALVLDDLLLVANLGDCRAVVSEGGKAVALTREHRPGTARDERDRVLSSGTPISRRGYVGHAVAMTRALGDWDLPGLKRVGDDGCNEGPVLADPEFRALRLRPGHHEFLILGSDGLWDALHSSQRVVDVARRCLARRDGDPKKCAARVAAAAVRAARKAGARADNVTVVVVCFPARAPGAAAP